MRYRTLRSCNALDLIARTCIICSHLYYRKPDDDLPWIYQTLSYKNQWCLTKLDDNFWLKHKCWSVWDIKKVLMLVCLFLILFYVDLYGYYNCFIYTHIHTFLKYIEHWKTSTPSGQIMWLYIKHHVFFPIFCQTGRKSSVTLLV